jgi:hypothetical protein
MNQYEEESSAKLSSEEEQSVNEFKLTDTLIIPFKVPNFVGLLEVPKIYYEARETKQDAEIKKLLYEISNTSLTENIAEKRDLPFAQICFKDTVFYRRKNEGNYGSPIFRNLTDFFTNQIMTCLLGRTDSSSVWCHFPKELLKCIAIFMKQIEQHDNDKCDANRLTWTA